MSICTILDSCCQLINHFPHLTSKYFLHKIYVRFRFLSFFFNGKCKCIFFKFMSCSETYNKVINNLLKVQKHLILSVIFQYILKINGIFLSWKNIKLEVHLLFMKFSETLIFRMLYFLKIYPVFALFIFSCGFNICLQVNDYEIVVNFFISAIT